MAITLLEMLLEAGMISPAQCDEALQNRVFFGGRIGTNLVELNFVEEETLALFLSRKLSVPYVEPERLLNLPARVIGLVSQELALKYHVIPLGLENRRLSLAMADPSDLRAIDDIAFITGWVVKPLVCPEIRVIQALGRFYHGEVEERYRQLVRRMEKGRENPPPEKVAEVESLEVTHAKEGAEVTIFGQSAANSPMDGPENSQVYENKQWIEQVDRFSVDHIRRALAATDDREEIAEILVSYLARKFDRVALFLVRSDIASGWKARAGKKDLSKFPLLHVPLFRPSVLKTVAQDQGYYLGPIPDTPWNSRLLEGLDCERPETVLVMPLTILGRVVGLLYLQGGNLHSSEGIGKLQKLLAKAGQAFEVLILREKILLG